MRAKKYIMCACNIMRMPITLTICVCMGFCPKTIQCRHNKLYVFFAHLFYTILPDIFYVVFHQFFHQFFSPIFFTNFFHRFFSSIFFTNFVHQFFHNFQTGERQAPKYGLKDRRKWIFWWFFCLFVILCTFRALLTCLPNSSITFWMCAKRGAKSQKKGR